MKLFGWEIEREDENEQGALKTFTPPVYDDGALTVQSGSYYGTYVDMEGVVRNEMELISRYREMSVQPELDDAIQDIVNEAIIMDKKGNSVKIVLDELEVSDDIKEKIEDEFDYILKLLGFSDYGPDIFRTWYIDGRLFYHVAIDQDNPKEGIQELRYIDPRKIRKIRELTKERDQETGMEVIVKEVVYYLYNERGIVGGPGPAQYSNLGHRIAADTVLNVNSGLLDSKRNMVLSHLHKAIKPLNMLRMVEDASVIYRLSRAPERRVFYIDVGNMPTPKANQYLRDTMNKFRNKLVYDSSTGSIRDDRRHLAMLEDFWLPRREGQRGTEIDTLQGGQNLGKIEDVEYFEQKLYKALNIPYSRTQPDQGFNLGRTTEINRDEIKFNKFINRLRNKFAGIFDELLKRQLVLKQVLTEDEWEEFRNDVFFDWLEDNNITELKEAELNRERISLLQVLDPYIGRYFSVDWTYKNVLRFTEEEIEMMQLQIDEEKESGLYQDMGVGVDAMMGDQMGGSADQMGGPGEEPMGPQSGIEGPQMTGEPQAGPIPPPQPQPQAAPAGQPQAAPQQQPVGPETQASPEEDEDRIDPDRAERYMMQDDEIVPLDDEPEEKETPKKEDDKKRKDRFTAEEDEFVPLK